MAFISAVLYEPEPGHGIAAPQAAEVTLSLDEAARAADFRLALHDAAGRLARVAGLGAEAQIVARRSRSVTLRVSLALPDAPVAAGPDDRLEVRLVDARAPRGAEQARTVTIPARHEGVLRLSAHGDRTAPRRSGTAPIGIAAGTRIDTPDGPRPVESLRPGDLVLTRDNGVQPVRANRLAKAGDHGERHARRHLPVRIEAGALGFGLPLRDIRVAQGQRLVQSSIRIGLRHEAGSVMVRGKSLTMTLPGIRVEAAGPADFHMLEFDRVEVIHAEGAAMESAAPAAAEETGLSTLRSWEYMAAA